MKIIQPQDMNITTPNGSMCLKWNKNFGKLTTEKMQIAQKTIDKECIDRMEKYTPKRIQGGYLSQIAPKTGTVIGSGTIVQLGPYARFQYYGKLMLSVDNNSAFAPKFGKKYLTDIDLKHSKREHPMAGPFWFKRMVDDNKDDILKVVAEKVGGKAK